MAQIKENAKKRRAWLAVVFTLIMQGLGHVYCGRLARGLVFNFLHLLPIPIIIALFSISNSPRLMSITIVIFIISGIIQLIAIIDSAYIAKHAKADYKLKDYNRWYVYTLLVLIVASGSIGSALYLRSQSLEAFRVPAVSSYPTIGYNDRILTNKIAYKKNNPARGDLIVFIDPKNRHQNYIKRIVAISGDTVEIKDNQLYVNDQKLERTSVGPALLITQQGESQGEILMEKNGQTEYKIFLAKTTHNPASQDFAKITIPKHHCFVLGDNRNNSLDSRHFGPILLATIKGRADYLYWPAKNWWSRFGRLGPERLPNNER